jgi:hypothetical protein
MLNDVREHVGTYRVDFSPGFALQDRKVLRVSKGVTNVCAADELCWRVFVMLSSSLWVASSRSVRDLAGSRGTNSFRAALPTASARVSMSEP